MQPHKRSVGVKLSWKRSGSRSTSVIMPIFANVCRCCVACPWGCVAKTAIINLTFATIVSMLLWRKLMYNFPNEENSLNKLKLCEVDRDSEGPCWFDSFVRLNTLDNSFVTQTLAIQLLVIKVNILFQQLRKLNKAFMKWKLREQLSWYENLVSDHPYWLVIQPIGGERRLNHIQKKFSTFN